MNPALPREDEVLTKNVIIALINKRIKEKSSSVLVPVTTVQKTIVISRIDTTEYKPRCLRF